nr:hypothetical protein [Tanacetum cinerariifolium]
MRIDELHKFSDGTLNDVRTALDDPLKGIRMKYPTQTIWRKSDMERAATMIQAIDKQRNTRRIMGSLEKFVGERLGIVTHWFTLIVLSALRRSDTENMLSLVNPHGFTGNIKGKWRYLISAEPQIHNHMIISYYQDFKIKTFATLIGKRKPRKRQNRIKTGQKREA